MSLAATCNAQHGTHAKLQSDIIRAWLNNSTLTAVLHVGSKRAQTGIQNACHLPVTELASGVQ